MYIYVTESLCCAPESNTLLQINCTSLKKGKTKKYKKEMNMNEMKNNDCKFIKSSKNCIWV